MWPGKPHAKYEALDACATDVEEEHRSYHLPSSRRSSRSLCLVTGVNILVLILCVSLAANSLHSKASTLNNRGNALLRASDWFCTFPPPPPRSSP